MLKTGLPDGAVRQKMSISGMSADDIAAFFGESSSSGGSDVSGKARSTGNQSSAGGGDLLSAIKAGAKLKKVDKRHTTSGETKTQELGMGGLLAELKGGGARLRKISPGDPLTRRRANTAPVPRTSGNPLLDAIKAGPKLKKVKRPSELRAIAMVKE